MRKVNLNSEKETQQLRDDILKKEGKLNHVIVSVGGWRTDGKLSTVSVDTYEAAVRDMTLPHFICYKTFSQLLSENAKSSYTFVTSGAGESRLFDPKASMKPVTGKFLSVFLK
jgi:NAD(P)-dependent dehydrogenase (short-subunit alcohol dehydrogenase family)